MEESIKNVISHHLQSEVVQPILLPQDSSTSFRCMYRPGFYNERITTTSVVTGNLN